MLIVIHYSWWFTGLLQVGWES